MIEISPLHKLVKSFIDENEITDEYSFYNLNEDCGWKIEEFCLAMIKEVGFTAPKEES